MIKLSKKEKQEVVTNCDHLKKLKYSPVLPYAFTEHGTLQAANVLNSTRADQMSVYIIRAFVKMREEFSTHKELKVKFELLESKVGNNSRQIKILFEAIRQFLEPPVKPKRRIGFGVNDDEK